MRVSSRSLCQASKKNSMGDQKKPRLPNGWIVRVSKTFKNRLYYFNTETGCSAWELDQVFPDCNTKPKIPDSFNRSVSESSSFSESALSPPILTKVSIPSSDSGNESICTESRPDRRKIKLNRSKFGLNKSEKAVENCAENFVNPATEVTGPANCDMKSNYVDQYSCGSVRQNRNEVRDRILAAGERYHPYRPSVYLQGGKKRNLSEASSERGSTYGSNKTFGREDNSKKRCRENLFEKPQHIVYVKETASFNERDADDSSVCDMEVDELPALDQTQVVMELVELRHTIATDPPTNVTGELTELSAKSKGDLYVSSAVKTLYIVIDTNIFLSALKMVDTIAKLYEDYEISVFFIIPWVVLHELDVLKKNQRTRLVAKHAQAANRYLYNRLSSPKSRFRGQTVAQATETTFPAKSCDDRILQCCLQFKQRGSSSVILFSNDVNLNMKAIVNNVHAYNAESIDKGIAYSLNKLKQQRIDNVMELPKGRHSKISTPCQVPLPSNNDVYHQLNETLLNSLSVVLQSEMESVFKELWEKIVLIKPPWSLVDVFKCIEKHWISVFGFFIRRTFVDEVVLLRKYFERDRGLRLPLRDLQQAIQRSVTFYMHLQHHSDYGGVISSTLQTLSHLNSQCTNSSELPKADFEIKSSNLPQYAATNHYQSKLTLPETNLQPKYDAINRSNTSVAASSNHYKQLQTITKNSLTTNPRDFEECWKLERCESRPMQHSDLVPSCTVVSPLSRIGTDTKTDESKRVAELFHTTWAKIHHYSGLLSDCFGQPHNIQYTKPESLPSKEDALVFLHDLYPVVNRMWKGLKSITAVPPSRLGGVVGVVPLYEAFVNLPGILSETVETNVTPTALHSFCIAETNRTQLKEGLWQLGGYKGQLYQLCTLEETV